MAILDARYEEMLVAITACLKSNRYSDVPDQLLATLVFKAILEAGFVPLKSSADLAGETESKEAV